MICGASKYETWGPPSWLGERSAGGTRPSDFLVTADEQALLRKQLSKHDGMLDTQLGEQTWFPSLRGQHRPDHAQGGASAVAQRRFGQVERPPDPGSGNHRLISRGP